MSFIHQLTISHTANGGTPLQGTIERSGDAELNLSITVPANSTAYQAAAAIEVAQLKMVLLMADRDIVIKTNSSSSPDDTIELDASAPKAWLDSDGAPTCPFTEDVITLFLVNAGSVDALVNIKLLLDVTAS